jgi:hypothetical protein
MQFDQLNRRKFITAVGEHEGRRPGALARGTKAGFTRLRHKLHHR